MVSLPLSHASRNTAGRFSLASLSLAVVEFFDILAASARVAQAMEARRQPRAADLSTLGIKGPLPKVW